MEYHKRYNLAYRFAQFAPYTKGRFVGHMPFISRAKPHARILPTEYGEPIVFRFHSVDILVIYPDGRGVVNYGGYAGAANMRDAMGWAASRCGFDISTCTARNGRAEYSVFRVSERNRTGRTYRVARGAMEFDAELNLLTQEGLLPELVTNKGELAAMRASLEPFMVFAALVFETAQGNIGYVSPTDAVRIAQDTNCADEWEALVAYLKRHSVGYGRWGEPKRKCTLDIFKSFIAKTTLKMCKEKTWVQP